jgi:hypothetical protein
MRVEDWKIGAEFPADPPGVRPTFSPIGAGIKRLGCEVEQSPQSSTKVKNVWSNTSTNHICFLIMVFN